MPKMTAMRAIRAKCLDCSGTSNEVKLCTVTDCALFAYRFGKNPAYAGRKGNVAGLEAYRIRQQAEKDKGQ